ncbi:MAG: peptidyl-prolyl cis-trans isomerase [Acidobacteriota bacterium]
MSKAQGKSLFYGKVAGLLLAWALLVLVATVLPADARAAVGPPWPVPQEAVAVSKGGIIDRIVVRVNGEAILQSQLEKEFADSMERLRGQIPPEQLEAQEPNLRLAQLGGMVETLMVQQKAEELGITADANDIDRALSRLMQENNISSQGELEQALATDGISLPMLRDELRKNYLRQSLLYQEVYRQIFVSQSEMQEYYEAHLDQFREPEQVLFQQIIFLLEGKDEETVARTAEAALAELRSGVSMSAVAPKYEGAQLFGGDNVSWVSVEDLQSELADALRGLSPGTYSEPIKGKFGYHLIQLLDRREEKQHALEEVASEIEQTVMAKKQSERLEKYTKELRDQSYIEVLAPEYANLFEDWGDVETANPAGEHR